MKNQKECVDLLPVVQRVLNSFTSAQRNGIAPVMGFLGLKLSPPINSVMCFTVFRGQRKYTTGAQR